MGFIGVHGQRLARDEVEVAFNGETEWTSEGRELGEGVNKRPEVTPAPSIGSTA